MAIRFQYNKTSLQDLGKQLKVRQRALPTLQNKESALRMEVKKAKDQAAKINADFDAKLAELEGISRLWNEFDSSLLVVSDVRFGVKKIAGVKTPVLEEVVFAETSFPLFTAPAWYPDGLSLVRELAKLAFEREFFLRKMHLLDFARKKTTQKVNLYEKVQIPGFADAIRKIKRFLEDEDNLSKSAQKIVKSRARESEAAG
ncbi:MAG TPA: V-type ATP synthase subunit D [Spirochaetota bacterium]|nr:V-type ATP synthase subunit D [Spirochaetota bacterium]HPH02107.1 V-type ATP synthase subunit D [Spirochaetota bacterium]